MNRNLLVPHYLIHCYIYYEIGDSIISDDEFDQLAKRIYDEWDDIEHMHKHLIDRDSLSTGGSYLRTRYTNMIIYSAYQLLKERGNSNFQYKDGSNKQDNSSTDLISLFG
jgi:hypothetical protein